MATFLYFLPGTLSLTDVPEPLKPIFDGTGFGWAVCDRGPEGLNGLIVTPNPRKGGEASIPGYYPDAQTWTKVEPDGYWIGCYNAAKPTAFDLLRFDEGVPGLRVEMKGQTWVIPVLHASYSTIPTRMRMTGAGPRQEFDPQYEKVCQHSERWWNVVYSQNEYAAREGATEEYNFCCELLALNYRVGPWEISALDLLGRKEMRDVIEAALGLPFVVAEIEAREKKLRRLLGADTSQQPVTC